MAFYLFHLLLSFFAFLLCCIGTFCSWVLKWLHFHVIAVMGFTCDHPDLFHLCLVLLPFLVYLSPSSSCSVCRVASCSTGCFLFSLFWIFLVFCALFFVFPVSSSIKLCFWTSDCLTCEESINKSLNWTSSVCQLCSDWAFGSSPSLKYSYCFRHLCDTNTWKPINNHLWNQRIGARSKINFNKCHHTAVLHTTQYVHTMLCYVWT